MARRPITPAIYTSLIAAYRDDPANHRQAAKQAGVFWRTAKRGWEEGWPAYPWAAKPIREVIMEEQAMARQRLSEADTARQESLKRNIEDASRKAAELAVQPQAERDLMKKEAIEAREQEGLAVRLARTQAIGLLQTMGELVPAIQHMVQKLAKRIMEEGLGNDMTVGSMIRMLREFTAGAKAVNEATEMALKMERLVLGQPTELLGLMAVDMSTEEAINEIMATSQAIIRAQGGRLLPAGETIDTTFTPAEQPVIDVDDMPTEGAIAFVDLDEDLADEGYE